MARATEEQYCLVQSNLDPIEPNTLKAAFRAVGELVDSDAKTLSADAFGILADGLRAETARIVAGQLAQAGIQVDVVHHDQIPTLPDPHTLRRAGCGPKAFMPTDSLGRDEPVDWSRVILIAAGIVPLRETKRKIRTRYKVRYVGGVGLGLGHIPPVYVVPERELSIRYQRKSRGLLDVFVKDEPYRYHIRAEKFNYNYLGDRQTNNKMENFTQLVHDVVSYATAAALNRGAVAIKDEGIEAIFSYPSKHAFEEETIWLLYKFGQQRGRDWPWMRV
ncbi:MAG: hypothetical protein GWP14_08200 [Actinobacteria bacterium]|nr:hypothetical protein [Actinomycetota bacterium]